jgi:hypothetical protein
MKTSRLPSLSGDLRRVKQIRSHHQQPDFAGNSVGPPNCSFAPVSLLQDRLRRSIIEGREGDYVG